MVDGLQALRWNVGSCRRCDRLVAHQKDVKRQNPQYWCAPVPSWGAARPRLLIVGLAPGLQGAGRTGKGFVGDASGAFLFGSLFRFGFATNGVSELAKLRGAAITNIVKCLPPDNRPSSLEKRQCEEFLAQEIEAFWPRYSVKNRVILCLGKEAFDSVARLCDAANRVFVHGTRTSPQRNFHIFASYHPSRLNVNTKRLTRKMFDDIFVEIKSLLD